MSLWAQTLSAFALTLLVLGYFQYRRHGDVIKVGQELVRPSFWVPALIISAIFLVLRIFFSGLDKIF